MKRLAVIVVVAIAVARCEIMPPRCEVCRAAEPGSAPLTSEQPETDVLVLQDGGVLVGRISRSADRYVVTQAGGEVQVTAGSVLLVCRSLDEAYEQRRQQLGRPTAEAHLALADWCLRYNLFAQAARELLDARGLDPRHPRLALLERRLAVASSSGLQERAPATTTVASQRTLIKSETLDQVGASANELPDGVVKRFTRKVQPVLVNNCTTAGCHQPGGPQQFQLDRALLHGLANRRSTMRNLAATLALVDRERPQLSPLLAVPRQSHGGLDAPVFGPRQEQAFTHLVEWVALVTQASTPSEGKIVADNEGTVPIAGTAPAAARSQADEGAADVAQASYDEDASAIPAPPRLRFGARLQPWKPRDPFDPEIFNRQAAARGSNGSEGR